MRIDARTLISKETASVIVSHKGEELNFAVPVFGRDNFQKTNVFEQINGYWNYLPANIQDAIFLKFKNIYDSFSLYNSRTDLTNALIDQVKELVDMHDIDHIKDWLVNVYNLHIPVSSKIPAEYKHSIDNNTSREKTYTRGDYLELVALSVLLRVMIPVWGEYIALIRKETGNEFKEFFAFQLLNKTNIINSTAMNKLRVYVEHTIGEKKLNPNHILNSISAEDFPYWMLAVVVIRRLSICALNEITSEGNPITFIYMFIYSKINKDKEPQDKIVRIRKDTRDGAPIPGKADDNLSSIETYKIKSDVSLGDLEELEVTVENPYLVANKLSSLVDKNMLERSLITSKELSKHRLLGPQITLLRWVFKPVISPQGVLYLSESTIVKCLGILQSVLWSRGHRYLAILSTCHSLVSENVMRVAPIDSMARVDKTVIENLNKLYPASIITKTRKTDPMSVKKPPLEVNLVTSSIDELANSLTMFSWKATADIELVKQVTGNNNRMFYIKPDIKKDLIDLSQEIAERNWI